MRHQELWRAVGTYYGPTRICGPTGHAIGGTAQQALWSFYCSYRSRASALSVTTTGRLRSVGARTSPPPPEPARLARVDYGPVMQLANEGRSDAVRRDRRLRDRRSGPTRQSGSTGLGVQCKTTRRGMRWVFIILTSRSFFLGKPSHTAQGQADSNLEHRRFFSCNDTSGEDRYGFESE